MSCFVIFWHFRFLTFCILTLNHLTLCHSNLLAFFATVSQRERKGWELNCSKRSAAGRQVGCVLGRRSNEIRRNNKSPWICLPCSCINEQKVAKSVFIDDLLLELEFFLMKWRFDLIWRGAGGRGVAWDDDNGTISRNRSPDQATNKGRLGVYSRHTITASSSADV